MPPPDLPGFVWDAQTNRYYRHDGHAPPALHEDAADEDADASDGQSIHLLSRIKHEAKKKKRHLKQKRNEKRGKRSTQGAHDGMGMPGSPATSNRAHATGHANPRLFAMPTLVHVRECGTLGSSALWLRSCVMAGVRNLRVACAIPIHQAHGNPCVRPRILCEALPTPAREDPADAEAPSDAHMAIAGPAAEMGNPRRGSLWLGVESGLAHVHVHASRRTRSCSSSTRAAAPEPSHHHYHSRSSIRNMFEIPGHCGKWCIASMGSPECHHERGGNLVVIDSSSGGNGSGNPDGANDDDDAEDGTAGPLLLRYTRSHGDELCKDDIPSVQKRIDITGCIYSRSNRRFHPRRNVMLWSAAPVGTGGFISVATEARRPGAAILDVEKSESIWQTTYPSLVLAQAVIDGHHCLHGLRNGAVCSIDHRMPPPATTSARPSVLASLESSVVSIAPVPGDGHRAVIGTVSGGVHLYDLRVTGGRHLVSYKGMVNEHNPYECSVTSDGSLVLTCGEDHCVKIWSLKSGGDPISKIASHQARPKAQQRQPRRYQSARFLSHAMCEHLAMPSPSIAACSGLAIDVWQPALGK